MKTIVWKLTEKQKANINNKSRYLLVEGSAGSGKTSYACAMSIKYALEHSKAKCYVFRETLKDCKDTVMEEIKELLDSLKIPYIPNLSRNKFTLTNGSIINFRGLDKETKIRSINADHIYVEQAEETDRKSFNELLARIRGKVSREHYGQLIVVATPEEETHWIYEYFHRDGKGDILHFHYKDNPYLPKPYVNWLESLKEHDEELHDQLTLGLWGKLTDLIFTKWDHRMSSRGYSYYSAGVDFGYNNPSVFLLIGWLDGEPHIIDEIYQTHLLNHDFIELVIKMLNEHGLKSRDVQASYCDHDPDKIQEFVNAGFNALPANKSVKIGLDVAKRVTVHISKACTNFKREIKAYKYRKDKNKNPTEDPVKINDHAMDAYRYGVLGELGALIHEKTKEIDYNYLNQLNEF